MIAKQGFLLRKIVDEYMLVPVGRNVGLFKGVVLLNQVSSFLWERLQSPVSREDLLAMLLEEYDIDEQTASADLDSILEQFRQLDIIEPE